MRERTVGKYADLVLLRENPLEDLARAKEPVGLMVRGRWLGPEELEKMRSRTFADEPKK